ncbi:hypothetical protein [Fibrobacter sp. UWP2]|uniref:hypothetical protein n=1 Tax=Fibrobacter sp. UWP2 TaxID=1896216 RepID=UPI00091E1DA8|nr:hypothetical protein [Fibrobacter sp. UWP2]SHJ28813.1 hypothetical protein SAMN05720471_12526 [Fibrobacter sp. UWP2]
MRQFDVFVWGAPAKDPPFTDPALGWFLGNNINRNLENSDAEWLVFAHSSVNIDRDFLNDLAQAIEGFPMVDAFAPRVNLTAGGTATDATAKGSQKFKGGYVLQKWSGLQMIADDAQLRFVAAPHPLVAAFSRRIVQRTGRFDETLTTPIALVDFTLRMYHAGGRMFSIPYLVTNKLTDSLAGGQILEPTSTPLELSLALYKNFGFLRNFLFYLAHPGTVLPLLKNIKALDTKRDAAILLSKLSEETLKEITGSRGKGAH